MTNSKSKAGGVFPSSSPEISAITCSLVFPPAVDVLGYMLKTDSNILLVSDWLVVISAFSWSPKASGLGLKGRSLT
jgi:hypothetical protein